jgi:hypothetical protein
MALKKSAQKLNREYQGINREFDPCSSPSSAKLAIRHAHA